MGPQRFSPTTESIRVGVGEAKASREESLVTFALGSCVGIAIYDPLTNIGGLLHAMLPREKMYQNEDSDAMYVDSGVSYLCDELDRFPETSRDRFEAKIVGGSRLTTAYSQPVGPENIRVARKELKRQGIPVSGEHVDNGTPSSVLFDPPSGKLIIRTSEDGSKQI